MISKHAHDLKVNKPQDFWDYWKSFNSKKGNCDPEIEVENFTDFYKSVAENHITTGDNNYNHEFMRKVESIIADVDMDREINVYIDSPVFDR